MARRVVLVSCGSFNPPTIAHLRMMEVARDYLQSLPSPFSVVEGIFSPTSSAYVHKDLASDEHRLQMLAKATSSSSWLRVDNWEVTRGEWSRCQQVLTYHREAARRRLGDETIQCFFVCGGDLVDTFKRILPDGKRLWALEDIQEIVEKFGMVVVHRGGSEPHETLGSFGFHPRHIHIVQDNTCPNDVSSTRLRTAIEEGKSIRYCTPDGVVDYIEEHGLYRSSQKLNGTK